MVNDVVLVRKREKERSLQNEAKERSSKDRTKRSLLTWRRKERKRVCESEVKDLFILPSTVDVSLRLASPK